MKIGMADLNCIVEIIYSSNDKQTAFQEQANPSFKDHKMYKVKYYFVPILIHFVLTLNISILQLLHVIYFIQIIYIKILREKIKDSYS